MSSSAAEREQTRESSEDTQTNHERNHDDEKGEESSPQPVGFWDKSLNKVRVKVFGKWIGLTLFLSTAILAILSLYWGVLYNVEMNLNSLVVYVVNFEGTGPDAFVGPAITQITEKQIAENTMPHLGYITMPPSDFNNDAMLVRSSIYYQQAWAAVIINANASSALRAAVENGDASYDPLGACQIVYVQARDQDAYYDYIMPQLNMLQTEAQSIVGSMWTKMALANNSISRTNLQAVPQALSPAIGFSMFNLRPFGPPTATPAVSIGLIYLIIISFFTFSFFLPVHMMFKDTSDHPPLKTWQLIVWRWTASVLSYAILSLAYSLVSLAFQIPFSHSPAPADVVADNANAFGKASFFVYWMVNYVGMIALGLACENVAMIIGMPWTSIWLIFWVITNVCSAFYPIEVEPHFFYWGYAWPLHNIVNASRTIIFDTKSQLGLNFGILFAWGAVNTALFPFASAVQARQQQKEKSKDD